MICSESSRLACVCAIRGSVWYVSGCGTGRIDLPRQRGAQVGILGEQVVEDRGPAARLADDDDRRRDRLCSDLGMLFAPGDYTKPVLQGAHDVEVSDLHTDGRQPCLVDQPIGEAL